MLRQELNMIVYIELKIYFKEDVTLRKKITFLRYQKLSNISIFT